jgi:hypothetical protein
MQYSTARQKFFKTEEGNVITERRGIFTNPSKKGNLKDALFSNMYKQDRELLQKVNNMANKEREQYLKFVKERADRPAGNNFHPTGPQEYRDL